MGTLVRWEPFRELASFGQAMDRLIEEGMFWPRPRRRLVVARNEPFTLAVDLYEKENDFVLKASLPGISPEDVDISIIGDTVTIKGEFKADEEASEENFYRRERRYGAFTRSLALPVAIDAAMAEAAFENGVLTLTIPKAEEMRPKRIEVKAK